MCVLTVVELYDLTSKLAILQDLEGTIFFPLKSTRMLPAIIKITEPQGTVKHLCSS